MENIETHIAKDKEILDNPTTSPNKVDILKVNYMNWKIM